MVLQCSSPLQRATFETDVQLDDSLSVDCGQFLCMTRFSRPEFKEMAVSHDEDDDDETCSLAVFQDKRFQNVSVLDFIGAKDNGDGGDNWSYRGIRRAKLQSNRHHQQTNTKLFCRPDSLPVAQPTVSKQ